MYHTHAQTKGDEYCRVMVFYFCFGSLQIEPLENEAVGRGHVVEATAQSEMLFTRHTFEQVHVRTPNKQRDEQDRKWERHTN